MLPFEVNRSTPLDGERADEKRVGALLLSADKESSVLLDFSEQPMRVVAEVGEKHALPHLRTEGKGLDVMGPFATKSTLFGPVAQTLTRVSTFTAARTLRDLVARNSVARLACKRTILKSLNTTFWTNCCSRGLGPRPVSWGQAGVRHLEASSEEIRELRGETNVVGGIGDFLELRGCDVGNSQLLDQSAEQDAEVGDEGPGEGDGVDFALADDRAGLASDLVDRAEGDESGRALLDRPGLERVGQRALSMVEQFGIWLRSGHPEEVDSGG